MGRVTFTRTQVVQAQLDAHYSLFRFMFKKHFPESNFVAGDGDVRSKIVFIGEAPGVFEDKERKPFVGKSGQYLTDRLKEVGIKREEIFITNFLKYRPPNNRDPKGEEIPVCTHLLRKELEILSPVIVVPLGRFSTSLFFEQPHMGTLAGQMWVKRGYTVVPMYHPAAALHDNSGGTDALWREHIQTVADAYHGVAKLPLIKKPVERPKLRKGLTK